MGKEHTTTDAFGWKDDIEPGTDFVLLPEGPCAFTVASFARERKEMGKLGECNVAVLELECESEAGGETGKVSVNLALHRIVQFKLFQFFTAIGQRQHGDGPLKPDWSKVEGATGRCTLGVREWKGRDGETRHSNEVIKFLDPDADESGFKF